MKGVTVRGEASDCVHFIAPGQLFSSFRHDPSWLLSTGKLELNFNTFDWSCVNDNLASIEQL